MPFAACYRTEDLRADSEGTVLGIGSRLGIAGPEHAVKGAETLCGLPRADVTVVRHLFRADGRTACSSCAEAANKDRDNEPLR